VCIKCTVNHVKKSDKNWCDVETQSSCCAARGQCYEKHWNVHRQYWYCNIDVNCIYRMPIHYIHVIIIFISGKKINDCNSFYSIYFHNYYEIFCKESRPDPNFQVSFVLHIVWSFLCSLNCTKSDDGLTVKLKPVTYRVILFLVTDLIEYLIHTFDWKTRGDELLKLFFFSPQHSDWL
jgi:hypothetical protein